MNRSIFSQESITPTADIPMEASHSDVKKCIRKLEKKLKEVIGHIYTLKLMPRECCAGT